MAALAATAVVILRDAPPWTHPAPWLVVPASTALVTSCALGIALASLGVWLTRLFVGSKSWARALHTELRPVAVGLGDWEIVLVAAFSSVGEELIFRGLLAPWTGVLGSSLLFGLAHQTRGPSRWVWASWAALAGLGFGSIFALTGSLVGPLVAHALVNGANLFFLREHDLGDAGRRD